MKIEICEQMVQSWLLNCKMCEIVQTNWTISPVLMDEIKNNNTVDFNEIRGLMDTLQKSIEKVADFDTETTEAIEENINSDVQEEYDIELGVQANTTSSITEYQKLKAAAMEFGKAHMKKFNIFKNSKTEQFISQCEIDVVGVKFNNDKNEIYLVDSAFHKSGLGYHDAVATVLKKIIRATIVSDIIFGKDVVSHVVFVSPKCGASLEKQIKLVTKYFVDFAKIHFPNVSIELYFNEEFSKNIYLPLIINTKKLNNDNDLFMRSINLRNAAEQNLPKSSAKSKPSPQSAKLQSTNNKSMIFDILEDLKANGKMSSALVADLCDKDYSQKNMKLSYPLLIEKSKMTSAKNKNYYKNTFVNINGVDYFVCQEWTSSAKNALKQWFSQI